jgi:putative FmdB family regulatory protein
MVSIGNRRRGDARTFAGMTSAATDCDDRRAMPIYDYHCDHCGHSFSQVQPYSDEPVAKCPNCGKRPRRLIAPAAVVFKGSGWYKTDSRAPDKSESKAETKSESKSETKSETKSDSKPGESKPKSSEKTD